MKINKPKDQVLLKVFELFSIQKRQYFNYELVMKINNCEINNLLGSTCAIFSRLQKKANPLAAFRRMRLPVSISWLLNKNHKFLAASAILNHKVNEKLGKQQFPHSESVYSRFAPRKLLLLRPDPPSSQALQRNAPREICLYNILNHFFIIISLPTERAIS